MFADFNKTTKTQWLEQVEKDLRGQPAQTLNWQIGDLEFSPFYHLSDALANQTFIHQRNNAWEIGEYLVVTDCKLANAQALDSLNKGANALCFEFRNELSLEYLATLLKNIQHEWISTHFVVRRNAALQGLENFTEILKEKKQDAKIVSCFFDIEDLPVSKVAAWQKQLPKARLIAIDATTKFTQDDHVVTELLWAIRKANTWLTKIDKQGLNLQEYTQTLYFSFALSDNYFLNIAKIRAFKWLWHQIATAWGIAAHLPPFIEVKLSEKFQTADEHYNKIQSSVQAISAAASGVSRLVIPPSDAFKKANSSVFSRRIALNIHHLLQNESYIDQVIDPAAGSYFIECLTQDLAKKAWGLFQENDTV